MTLSEFKHLDDAVFGFFQSSSVGTCHLTVLTSSVSYMYTSPCAVPPLRHNQML